MYRFSFVESIYRSDFGGGPRYPGLQLCFQVLKEGLHCLCVSGIGFRSCSLTLL